MNPINYIKHLNGVFQQFSKDSRLNPTHISLYMGLFQLWNNYHFPTEFHINREEVMQLSKIGSKVTYHRCIKELSYWKYFLYMPSHNPYKGSTINMFNFETSVEQVLSPCSTKSGTSSEQALVPINKLKQTNKNNTNETKLDQPKNENEVIEFFKTKKWEIIEGIKFYNHYQGIGWKIRGKIKIVDWQATARNWMLKADEIKKEKTQKSVDQNRDKLESIAVKDYNEPL